ncbi:MAG: UbiA family prenyltransferase [Verrucomicrobia bacterium]|nr:UbiA family prenyltransferase [Verrucomicrobiota bacterium]
MREILVVDLDNTLLKSDMLFESFWSAFSRDWRSPFRSALALSRGKAALKHYLAEAAQIDVTTLPYDQEVIAYIEAWRDAGGRTALVTATDDKIAKSIGEHLQLFDEVHGSNGTENLKGHHKSRFLIDTYGERQFSYMGDSEADLAVWKHAKQAITINLSQAMKARAARVADEVEHLATHRSTAGAYLKAIRPHQWMKNALVALPMLAAHQLDGPSVMASMLAFLAFSMVASSVYIVNDLLDLNADRAHPRKRQRPFAAGRIPIASGTWMAAALLATGMGVAAFLGPAFLGVMLGYYALTTAYSVYLKRRIIVDICVLAGLYTVRIVAGSAATDVPLSVWLLAFSIFFFLSLAAVKRQAELVDSAKQGRLKATGRGYHVTDLPIISMISISAGYVAVLVLALYVNSPAVTVLYSHPEALWGVCTVLLYWITRTVLLTHRGAMHDDPLVYAARDRISQACFLIALAFVMAGALL